MATPPAKPPTFPGQGAGVLPSPLASSLAVDPGDVTTVEESGLISHSPIAGPAIPPTPQLVLSAPPVGGLYSSSLPAINLSPAPPERYGKYNLLERIGVGGMAEVWRAKTLGTEGFTKDLVIKRILPRFTRDDDFVRMFIDEARLVAKLQHANIVQIFDFDREGDTYYLAMELVEGSDLRQIEKAAAKAGVWLSISAAVYLIAEALKGLQYAHTKAVNNQPLQLVHRDISPHNILISHSGEVKIADFGIAKVADRVSKTVNGMVKGKLAYMSPEQITGQTLDCRTDIYSMGVVLWELITKNRLFHGPLEGEVIRRVRDGIVPPPRQVAPGIPESLERVVMKMLLPDRARRYQSAGDVVRDLCALSCYAYEAQALGDLIRALLPHKERDWTQMLQSVNEPAPALLVGPAKLSVETTTSLPASRPAPLRSNMAGSDQKTVMATEIPPEVAARLSQQNPQQAVQTPANAPAQARTMMAQAPVLPQGPAQQPAGARTMMAQAPVLPQGGPPLFGGPPPPAVDLPPVVAAGGYAQGLPPPAAPLVGAGAAPPLRQGGPINPQATVMMDPRAATSQAGPGVSESTSGRPLSAPLPLRPANAVFGPGETVSSAPPYLRWILGPALSVVLALFTLFLSNRIGTPGGPSFTAPKGKVHIVTSIPGATVYQDGMALADKTPTDVKGDVGKKAHVKVELAGYDPYEAVIPFTKDERPPLNVTLFLKGKSPNKGKSFDQTVYDERPGTKTTRDPDADDEKTAADEKDTKVVVAEHKLEKAVPDELPKDKGEADEEPKDKHSRHHHGKDKDPATVTAKPAGDKGKPSLSVSVRPWAIVYIDGKKVGQTPLRDYPLSPGKHTLLLVNDNKGKRETVSVTATPGSFYPITRSWE